MRRTAPPEADRHAQFTSPAHLSKVNERHCFTWIRLLGSSTMQSPMQSPKVLSESKKSLPHLQANEMLSRSSNPSSRRLTLSATTGSCLRPRGSMARCAASSVFSGVTVSSPRRRFQLLQTSVTNRVSTWRQTRRRRQRTAHHLAEGSCIR